MLKLKSQAAKVSTVHVEKTFVLALSILNASANRICCHHLIGW